MSEQELIHALRDLIARHSQSPEPEQSCSEIIFRDRWRVRVLAGVTAALWLGGIAGMLYMVFWFNEFVQVTTPPWDRTAAHVFQSAPGLEVFHTMRELHHSLEGCMVAVPALLLAALCTVWLVFSSRKATLNQINVSLASISQQLRDMRQDAARPPEIH
jgi:hypothetical protein